MSWTQIHNHSTVPVPHEPSWARVILLSLLQVLSTLHRSVFFEIIPVSHYASSFFKRFLKKIIRVLTFQVLKLVLTTCTRSHPSLRSIFTSSHPAVKVTYLKFPVCTVEMISLITEIIFSLLFAHPK